MTGWKVIYSKAHYTHARRLLDICRKLGWRLVTVESCTGGLISGLCTEIAGASDILQCGLVTYSNESKTQLANVPEALIAKYGAVSQEVAYAMAEGALELYNVQLALSVTGIAGPGGGSAEKPVGLVHMAAACKSRETLHRKLQCLGDRQSVRLQAVEQALMLGYAQCLKADQNTV